MAVDLRTIIPSVDAVRAPLAAILGDQGSGLIGVTARLEGQDFGGSAGALGALFQRELVRIPQIVELIGGVAGDVERARGGDLAPLVQRAGAGLNGAVQAISGPDLAGFDEWRRYLLELADLLRPLVDAGGTPDEIRA